MNLKYWVAFLGFMLQIITLGCGLKVSSHFCTTDDIVLLPTEEKKEKVKINSSCKDPLVYAPDSNYISHFPMRYIRVNFHFVNSSDSSKNFNGQMAIDYAYNLVANANSDLSQNMKMHLPLGNQTPVLPVNFRYRITPKLNDSNDKGVYFHYDDQVCYYVHKGKNQNIYDKTVIKKYAVQADSVMNIFIMPHHPDSIKSSTYPSGGVGVMVGSHIKMAGMYDGTTEFWKYRQILNHETGHVLGLMHSWQSNDGCEDTPVHSNCWNISGTPPCDSLYSNNVMDYNAWQLAWTPCQIGRVHRMMATIGSPQRKLLLPTWCQLNEACNITILDTAYWNGAKDLEGNITIMKNGFLSINCRVSLPLGAKITIAPGGTLLLNNAHLHNDCGQLWQGIEIQTQGKRKGKLLIKGLPKIENTEYALPDFSNLQ
jgi:hypothetical protein